MRDQPETRQELGPEELHVAEMLGRDRPVPGAHFRGALGRRLSALDPGWGARPAWLIPIVCAYVALGLLLVGLGALSGLGAL